VAEFTNNRSVLYHRVLLWGEINQKLIYRLVFYFSSRKKEFLKKNEFEDYQRHKKHVVHLKSKIYNRIGKHETNVAALNNLKKGIHKL